MIRSPSARTPQGSLRASAGAPVLAQLRCPLTGPRFLPGAAPKKRRAPVRSGGPSLRTHPPRTRCGCVSPGRATAPVLRLLATHFREPLAVVGAERGSDASPRHQRYPPAATRTCTEPSDGPPGHRSEPCNGPSYRPDRSAREAEKSISREREHEGRGSPRRCSATPPGAAPSNIAGSPPRRFDPEAFSEKLLQARGAARAGEQELPTDLDRHGGAGAIVVRQEPAALPAGFLAGRPLERGARSSPPPMLRSSPGAHALIPSR